MPRPKKVVLHEDRLDTAEQVHEILAAELRFPGYYGANFDALADCLADIRRPTRIVLHRDNGNEKPWFDTLEQVVRDSAQSSCYLGCTIRRQ